MKAYTSPLQSVSLGKFLSLESADMYYHTYPSYKCWHGVPNIGKADLKDDQMPCWSLAALLNVINDNYYTTLYHDGVAWNVKAIHHDNVKNKHNVYANTPIDCCYEMILKLHELNLL